MVTKLKQSLVTAINTLGTSPMPVIGSNDTRTAITFHNPGPNTAVVFPQYVIVNGQTVPLVPSLSSLGGGFVVAFGATLFIGEPTCKQSWQALALTGTGNPLTVQEQT